MEEKCIRWIGSSRKNILAFPVDARKEAGYQLSLVQLGDDPEDWKPMRGMGMGMGVREIRIHKDGEFRVIYVATFEEAIYVLHAFAKKTQQTPKRDIDIAKTRFRQLRRGRE